MCSDRVQILATHIHTHTHTRTHKPSIVPLQCMHQGLLMCVIKALHHDTMSLN